MSVAQNSRIGASGWDNIGVRLIDRNTSPAGNTITLNLTGVQAGDYAIIVITINANPALTISADWTPIVNTTTIISGKRMASFYRKIDGSEGTSVDITANSTPTSTDAVLIVIKNALQIEQIASYGDSTDPATWLQAPVSEGGALDVLITASDPSQANPTWTRPNSYTQVVGDETATRTAAWVAKLPPATEAPSVNSQPSVFSTQFMTRAIFSAGIPQSGGGTANTAFAVRPYSGTIQFTNMPLAQTIQRTFVCNTSGMTEARIVGTTAGDNVAGSTLSLAYLGALNPPGSVNTISGVSLSFTTDAAQDSGWQPLPANATGENVVFALVTAGGNGSADPQIAADTLRVEFRP